MRDSVIFQGKVLPVLSCEEVTKMAKDEIKTKKRKAAEIAKKELILAATPLIEYIRKTGTPMTTAIVTGVGVEVLSTDVYAVYEKEWD